MIQASSANGDLSDISDDLTDDSILSPNRWREWGLPCFCFALSLLESSICKGLIYMTPLETE